ncbi:MAG: flagellin, partial [Pseudomonadota bacterium]
IRMAIRADDPAFKDVLRDIALAALATDPALNLAPNSQSFLIESSGERLLNSRDDLIGMRAEVGFAQNRIAEARTRNASAQTSLDYTRAALLRADPYDVATRLEAAQFQLESLYSATVRNSRLSLVNFLR